MYFGQGLFSDQGLPRSSLRGHLRSSSAEPCKSPRILVEIDGRREVLDHRGLYLPKRHRHALRGPPDSECQALMHPFV